MAAKFKLIEDAKFNPSVTTLEEFLMMYGKLNDPKKPAAWGATLRNNEYFKPFLNKTLTELLEFGSDMDNNPLYQATLEMIDKAKKNPKTKDKLAITARRKIYSLVSALEANVEKHWYKVSNQPLDLSLTGIVFNPSKPKPKSYRYTFNTRFLPKYLLKLAQHAADNPKDRPVVRALMFQIAKGLRPGEVANLTQESLKPRLEGSVTSGLVTFNEKMSKIDRSVVMNLPLGPMDYAILQQAMGDNQARKLLGGKLPIFVKDDGKPVTTSDMTRVTKLIKVPGILTDYEPEVEFDDDGNVKRIIRADPIVLDTVPIAYFWRNFNATLAFQAGLSHEDAGRDVGRDLSAGGGEQKGYISPEAGFYSAQQANAAIQKNKYLWDMFLPLIAAGEQIPEGFRLDWNTDLINVAETGGKYPIIDSKQDTNVKTIVNTADVPAGNIQVGTEDASEIGIGSTESTEQYKVGEVDKKPKFHYLLKKKVDKAVDVAKKVGQSAKDNLNTGIGFTFGGLTLAGLIAAPKEAIADIAKDVAFEKFFLKLGLAANPATGAATFASTVLGVNQMGGYKIDPLTKEKYQMSEMPPSTFLSDEEKEKIRFAQSLDYSNVSDPDKVLQGTQYDSLKKQLSNEKKSFLDGKPSGITVINPETQKEMTGNF